MLGVFQAGELSAGCRYTTIHPDDMKKLFGAIDSEYTHLWHGTRLLRSRMISYNPEIILAL